MIEKKTQWQISKECDRNNDHTEWVRVEVEKKFLLNIRERMICLLDGGIIDEIYQLIKNHYDELSQSSEVLK